MRKEVPSKQFSSRLEKNFIFNYRGTTRSPKWTRTSCSHELSYATEQVRTEANCMPKHCDRTACTGLFARHLPQIMQIETNPSKNSPLLSES